MKLPGGTLQEGAPADIVVIDETLEKTVDGKSFYSKGERIRPTKAYSLKGWPVMTLVDGIVKMENGVVKE